MHISSLEEYGVRCAVQLARHFQKGPLPASKIAEAEGISVEYVSKIMHLFRKAQLITASRGIQGGFALKDSPEEVTLKHIFDSLAGKKATGDFCSHFTGQQEKCVHYEDCSVKPVWYLISTYFDSFLVEITLKDLIFSQLQVEEKIAELATKKAKMIRYQVDQKKLNPREMNHEQNPTI